VARALELGVNFFDTASTYGSGLSETHLGQALRALRAAPHVATKVRLAPPDLGDIPAAVVRSVEASLGRLGMERVDLLQFHNPFGLARQGGTPGLEDVLAQVLPTFERLRREGKIGFAGITALGETAAIHRVVESGAIDTAQVCYNLLCPSPGFAPPPGFPAQDFDRLLDRASAQRVGVIVIRVMAAGALSGEPGRHPLAMPEVEPIASGPDYATDLRRARGLDALVREGHVGSLVEAALRFPLGHAAVSTVLLGYSSLEHLERAAAAIARGPLSPAAMARLATLWDELARGV
jgi:aryl-alcohol dehydrogenase-like predicted oxidoreductase